MAPSIRLSHVAARFKVATIERSACELKEGKPCEWRCGIRSAAAAATWAVTRRSLCGRRHLDGDAVEHGVARQWVEGAGVGEAVEAGARPAPRHLQGHAVDVVTPAVGKA